jgi:hypothetical protein
MAYIGNKPEVGNFRKCDAITTSATATYNLLVDSVAVNPNQNQCVVSLNGVVQSSGDSYTIASSQITFASALTSSDVIDFILILGDVLDVGVPSDDTVDASKITANVITGQSALGAAPADTDEFLVSDAGTLKRVDYSYIKGITQTSFLPTAQPLIINGNMAVAQRGTSTASISGGTNDYYTCDRWKFDTNGSQVWTQSQDTDVPSGYGFGKSFKLDCTTLDATPDATIIHQNMEGQDVQVFKKGTANAEKLTLAFWVKSVKTGTYICELRDFDNNRTVSQAYTVDSGSTWEKKIVNFPADTTGTLDDDNARSFSIGFWLGASSTYSSGTLATAWESRTNANRAVGQVNVSDSTSNNFWLTGVQLEVGEYTSADLPPFRHESFGDNLFRCQRYYETQTGFYWFGFQSGTNVTHNSMASCKVEKRATPSGTYSGSVVNYYPNTGGGNDETNNITAITIGDKNGSTFVGMQSEAGAPTDAGYWPVYADARNAVLNWDAEL